MGNVGKAQRRASPVPLAGVREHEAVSTGYNKIYQKKSQVEIIPTDAQMDGVALAQKSVSNLLKYIGEDISREGLIDTPKRVIKSYDRLFGGYKMDPKQILGTTFKKEGYDEIILLDNIELYSTCEHHVLPFFGKAHVAYIPGERVVGLSKLARVVECFARRLQIQERLTNQIAVAIEEVLSPRAVAVIIQAKHFCMVSRGVEKQNSLMTTSCMRGIFKDDIKARTELMKLIEIE